MTGRSKNNWTSVFCSESWLFGGQFCFRATFQQWFCRGQSSTVMGVGGSPRCPPFSPLTLQQHQYHCVLQTSSWWCRSLGLSYGLSFACLPSGCLAEVRDEYPLPVTAAVIQFPFCPEKGRVMQEKLLQEVMKNSTVCCISTFIFSNNYLSKKWLPNLQVNQNTDLY